MGIDALNLKLIKVKSLEELYALQEEDDSIMIFDEIEDLVEVRVRKSDFICYFFKRDGVLTNIPEISGYSQSRLFTINKPISRNDCIAGILSTSNSNIVYVLFKESQKVVKVCEMDSIDLDVARQLYFSLNDGRKYLVDLKGNVQDINDESGFKVTDGAVEGSQYRTIMIEKDGELVYVSPLVGFELCSSAELGKFLKRVGKASFPSLEAIVKKLEGMEFNNRFMAGYDGKSYRGLIKARVNELRRLQKEYGSKDTSELVESINKQRAEIRELKKLKIEEKKR